MTNPIADGEMDQLLQGIYEQYGGVLYNLFLRLTQQEQAATEIFINFFIVCRRELRRTGSRQQINFGWLLALARTEVEKAGWDSSLLYSYDGLLILASRGKPTDIKS